MLLHSYACEYEKQNHVRFTRTHIAFAMTVRYICMLSSSRPSATLLMSFIHLPLLDVGRSLKAFLYMASALPATRRRHCRTSARCSHVHMCKPISTRTHPLLLSPTLESGLDIPQSGEGPARFWSDFLTVCGQISP